jgi:2,5-diketo-D-gluconate reductase A
LRAFDRSLSLLGTEYLDLYLTHSDPAIEALAKEHDRTPAQIVLRRHLQFGNIVIPKSVTPSRIRENLDVFGFTLSDDDLASIATLERGERTGPDPDTFNIVQWA